MTTRTVAFLAAVGVEEIELTSPWNAVLDHGAQPVLVSPNPGRIRALTYPERGAEFDVGTTTADADVGDYDALVIPGGFESPDLLRVDTYAVELVRGFVSAGKPVAAICHAPWVLIEADAVRGRALTAWPSLQTDIINAGGIWTDQPIVIDDPLITSRKPADLPAFNQALVQALTQRRTADPGCSRSA